MGASECQWVPVGAGGYQWVPVGTDGCQWVPMNVDHYQWVSMAAGGCWRALAGREGGRARTAMSQSLFYCGAEHRDQGSLFIKESI